MVLFIFLLRIGTIKCRFHHENLDFSKFHDFPTKIKVVFLWLFLITPYLSTWNIDLPPWDLFLYSNEENNIIIWDFVRDKCQVPNSDPHGSEYIISNLGFSFFWFMFDDFWWEFVFFFMKTWKVEDEECPDINFPLIKCTKAWIWI